MAQDQTMLPPTPYPELNRLLQTLVERIRTVLGEHLLSACLQGSFAVGDFDEAQRRGFYRRCRRTAHRPTSQRFANSARRRARSRQSLDAAPGRFLLPSGCAADLRPAEGATVVPGSGTSNLHAQHALQHRRRAPGGEAMWDSAGGDRACAADRSGAAGGAAWGDRDRDARLGKRGTRTTRGLGGAFLPGIRRAELLPDVVRFNHRHRGVPNGAGPIGPKRGSVRSGADLIDRAWKTRIDTATTWNLPADPGDYRRTLGTVGLHSERQQRGVRRTNSGVALNRCGQRVRTQRHFARAACRS